MKKILVVGLGEVGTPIKRLEEEAGNKVDILEMDIKPQVLNKDTHGYFYDVMHVCIPFSEKFADFVLNYVTEYHPRLTVIHSTVPVGTTQKIADQIEVAIVHSPVRGIHPNMYDGLKQFVKYIGGDNSSAEWAIEHFEDIGLEPYYLGSSQTTELNKLLSTAYYGWNILFAKEAQRICDYYGLDYDKVYTHPNKTYNYGYTRLGKENVVRPILVPPRGRIGGHCVSQNIELLEETPLKKVFKELNENE